MSFPTFLLGTLVGAGTVAVVATDEGRRAADKIITAIKADLEKATPATDNHDANAPATNGKDKYHAQTEENQGICAE